MKTKGLTTTGAALLLAAAIANADDASTSVQNWGEDHFTLKQNSGPLFNANEFSLDLFGSVYDDNLHLPNHHDELDGTLGFGLGANYFFTPNIGIGADTTIGDNGGAFFDYLAGSFILRFPLENIHLAPYGFAGITGMFDVRNEPAFHFGGGAEYRINAVTGFFTDIRYVVPDRIENFFQFRFGMKLVF